MINIVSGLFLLNRYFAPFAIMVYITLYEPPNVACNWVDVSLKQSAYNTIACSLILHF